jgi:hypothetical protein
MEIGMLVRSSQDFHRTWYVLENLSTILFNFLLLVITWQLQTSEAEAMPAPCC